MAAKWFWDDELTTLAVLYITIQKENKEELKRVLQRDPYDGENVLEKLFASGTTLCPSKCV